VIVVTGATGNIGRSLVEQLLAAGAAVRALSRDPERAGLPAAAETARADLTSGAPLRPVFEGARAVFLNLAATGVADPGAVIAAAAAAGVRRIVLNSSMSVTDTPADDDNVIARWHRAAEQAVRDSGLEWCFVRGGMYATNALAWAEQIRAEGVVHGPYPDAIGAPVHEADLAEVALRALLDEDGTHLGRTYVVTGPAGVTLQEQTEIVGRAIGRVDVRFERVPFEEGVAWLERTGTPKEVAADLLGFLGQTVGTEPLITDTVDRVTGHPARSFEEWARDHAEDFR
jgi:uncharacterized protein YbjT (DUF2867 family)